MRAKRPSKPGILDHIAAGVVTATGGLVGAALSGGVGGLAGLGVGAAAAQKMFGETTVITEKQMAQKYRDLIEAEKKVFDTGATVKTAETVPPVADIPLVDRSRWLRIPSVICVYIDMKDSTQLAAEAKPSAVASAFQLYTATAVRLLNAFGSPYIDVRGDGAFGLFDAGQEYVALCAAITFKTFASTVAVPAIEKRCGVRVGSHIGIDQGLVLVRRVGLRETDDRSDRQNEVWAGKPVNMAAKLAGMSADDEVLASKRFFSRIGDDRARLSCGCDTNGVRHELWNEVDVSVQKRFDFGTAYRLETGWCPVHGAEFMDALLRLNPQVPLAR